jgi:hypothetical protein
MGDKKQAYGMLLLEFFNRAAAVLPKILLFSSGYVKTADAAGIQSASLS